MSILAVIILLILAIPMSVAITLYVLKRREGETVVEEERVSTPNMCGICGAEINLGVFSSECRDCGAMFHSACVKGKRKCIFCKKPFR